MELKTARIMEVQELRIGNKVFADFEVYGYDYSEGDLTTYDGYGLHRIKPIPLTEEILLKAGFEKYKDTDFYIAHGFEIPYFKAGGDLIVEVEISKIKSVHQLQNLYYALTGEELNIEL